MNRKFATILLISLLFIVLSSNAVYAQDIMDWFKEDQDWPIYGTDDTDPIPRWYIALVWLALGTALWAIATTRIPFFKDAGKNAAVFFAFAFAGLVVSGSVFVNWLISLLGIGAPALVIVGAWSLLWILLGLASGGSGVGAKLIGAGAKLAAEGAEVAGEAKRDITGAEKKELEQKQLLQRLEQMEGAGIRDVEQIRAYVEELRRLLGDPNALKAKHLRQALATKINNINTVVRTLQLHTKNVQKVTRALEDASRREGVTLIREMTGLNHLRHSGAAGAHTGTGERDTSKITDYIDDLERNFKANYRSETDMTNIETRLNAAETALRTHFSKGVNALNANSVPIAESEFEQAIYQLENIGSELAALQRIEEGIDARIKRDFGDLTNAAKISAHLDAVRR